MSKLSFLFFLLVSFFTSAQQAPDCLWTKVMGGAGHHWGYSITTDASGNVYTTGFFLETVDFDPDSSSIFNLTSAGVADIFICKSDNSGNFIWAKRMGGLSADVGTSIVVDLAGNVYTTGDYDATADFDPGPGVFNLTSEGCFVSKLDASGNFVWAKAIGGEDSNSLAVDASGNIYVTGYFFGTADFDPDSSGIFNLTSAGNADIFICKLNSSGNLVWAKRMGGSYADGANSVALDLTGSGEVYTTGTFTGEADFDPDTSAIFNLNTGSFLNAFVFISKLDNSGSFVWAKAMGGIYFTHGNSIAIDFGDGSNVYTAGSFSGTVDFDPGAGVFNLIANGIDIFISKVDSLGNFIWAKRIGELGSDFCTSLAIDPAGSGDVYATGSFEGTVDFDPGIGSFNLTSAGGADILISKLDYSGNFVWAKAIGGIADDVSFSIALDASNHVCMVGTFYSPSIICGSSSLMNTDNTGTITDLFIAMLDNLITGIESVENNNGIAVYPNPASEEITVQLESNTHHIISISNTLGEILFQTETNSSTLQVDVSHYPAGVYFVTVKDEKGNGVTKKVAKQ